MNYFWASFGWIWGKKVFFGLVLLSALLFFALLFPFSDLSDVVTTTVARATNNQVFVQFRTLDLHVIPQPAVSAEDVSIETSLPPLEAKWAKVTPSLFSALVNLPTIIGAARGNEESARSLGTKLGASFAAEGILGGDVDLRLRAGSKSEQGHDRSRVSLALDKLELAEVQKWTDLPVKMSGELNVDTDVQFAPDMTEQPDGDYEIRLAKFKLPASTIMVPMGEANLPVNIPTLTLENVTLKGKLSNGTLMIDEGTFGKAKDPIYGRIKGSLGVRLQAQGPNVFPMFGSYNLTVELNTTQLIEKELGFAFIMFGSAKTPSPGGGAKYLFRAMGQGIGMQYVPNITRINSF